MKQDAHFVIIHNFTTATADCLERSGSRMPGRCITAFSYPKYNSAEQRRKKKEIHYMSNFAGIGEVTLSVFINSIEYYLNNIEEDLQ